MTASDYEATERSLFGNVTPFPLIFHLPLFPPIIDSLDFNADP